ncbi:conserved hypothetical protein [uncultured Pleomorphomonas sp.]|uniref:Uncharacterized protein n=1 Tax=uncultured Pleomorphomonas sp. TaxID=442121 RepID=A0A212LCX2_9HYPH|nr:hypothetical protein [uncultured Pleomorphomonas sp.]SCM75412.1 conserved hypothetical protein [uncultured Pleomorphomonas sp.]
MSYDYIRQAYGVVFEIGDRVQHASTLKVGTVVREGKTNKHYVRVRFAPNRRSYCHPLELKKLTPRPDRP